MAADYRADPKCVKPVFRGFQTFARVVQTSAAFGLQPPINWLGV